MSTYDNWEQKRNAILYAAASLSIKRRYGSFLKINFIRMMVTITFTFSIH